MEDKTLTFDLDLKYELTVNEGKAKCTLTGDDKVIKKVLIGLIEEYLNKSDTYSKASFIFPAIDTMLEAGGFR